MKRLVQRCLDNDVVPGIKLLEHSQDEGGAEDLVRVLSAVSGKDTTWRSLRSCVVADALELGDDSGETCGVRLSGYLRGSPLYVNSLMHLPGVGTARVVRVSGGKDCGPLEMAQRYLRRGGGDGGVGGAPEGEVVEADPTQ